MPRTCAFGEAIGGAAAATAAGGIGAAISASGPPAGSIGAAAPASGLGAGGAGGGISAGSSCSSITLISLSIICLITGEMDSITAFFASMVAASLNFFASISAS